MQSFSGSSGNSAAAPPANGCAPSVWTAFHPAAGGEPDKAAAGPLYYKAAAAAYASSRGGFGGSDTASTAASSAAGSQELYAQGGGVPSAGVGATPAVVAPDRPYRESDFRESLRRLRGGVEAGGDKGCFQSFVAEFPLYAPAWLAWGACSSSGGSSGGDGSFEKSVFKDENSSVAILRRAVVANPVNVSLWAALVKKVAAAAGGGSCSPAVLSVYSEALGAIGHRYDSSSLWKEAFLAAAAAKAEAGIDGAFSPRVTATLKFYGQLFAGSCPPLLPDLASHFFPTFAQFVEGLAGMAAAGADLRRLLEEALPARLAAEVCGGADAHAAAAAAAAAPLAAQRRADERREREAQMTQLREGDAGAEARRQELQQLFDAREARRRRGEEREAAALWAGKALALLKEAFARATSECAELLEPRATFEREIARYPNCYDAGNDICLQSVLSAVESDPPVPGATLALDPALFHLWRAYVSFELRNFAEVRARAKDPGELDLARALARKLLDRAVVACNEFPEFWLRYADWLAADEGDPAAALDLLARARLQHLPDHPALWVKSALIMEGSAAPAPSPAADKTGIVDQDRQPADLGEKESVGSLEKARRALADADAAACYRDVNVLVHRVAFETRNGCVHAAEVLLRDACTSGVRRGFSTREQLVLGTLLARLLTSAGNRSGARGVAADLFERFGAAEEVLQLELEFAGGGGDGSEPCAPESPSTAPTAATAGVEVAEGGATAAPRKAVAGEAAGAGGVGAAATAAVAAAAAVFEKHLLAAKDAAAQRRVSQAFVAHALTHGAPFAVLARALQAARDGV